MQGNLNINTLLDGLKKDVLENQHDNFASDVNIFIQKGNWFAVDKIQKFIGGHGNTFLDDKDGKMLFGVLKFFLDVALIQNRDIKTDDVYNLLNEFQDKLSWEQSCDLLLGFLDKDWDKGPNNKNLENAKELIDDLLSYLSKLKSKKVYTSEFSCVQKYFKKIMDDVPKIKTPKYLSYISKKLSETDFPPQFCFEIVWLFGDGLLKTDIKDLKDLGWHAQFARFRLEIMKIAEGVYPRDAFPQIYKNERESNFENRISNYFYNYQIDDSLGEEATEKLIGYLKNENVAWETKFSITNYLIFGDYYDRIFRKHCDNIPYGDLLTWKSMIKKKFESPNDLLNVFAKIFPYIKDFYDKYDVKYYCEDWLYILCFAYSKAEIYECIKNFENENDDAWKSMFLWKATTYYKKNLPESQVNITEFFKTPDEFLDHFLKDHGMMDKFDKDKIKRVSFYINTDDLFLYSVDEIKSFIENEKDLNKLVLLFYAIFHEYGCKAKSPSVALDIYVTLFPKIKGHLRGLDGLIYQGLVQSFNTEQLTGALKETDDPEKMILLITALNSYRHRERVKQIFDNPKDLFDVCVSKYESKEKNIEINEENYKCPAPLLNILKGYDEQALTGFTEYFKNENDPLAKSWLSNLVDVKQNFFETYRNVLDFLDKNKNCPQCVKNSLNGIIRKKCSAGFNSNDCLWLFGLEKCYCFRDVHHNQLMYLPESIIEERCKLISNLFSNSNEHGRTVISEWFIEPALKYHENIWKAVLGLIIYGDEQNQDIKDINLWRNLQPLCKKVDIYNEYTKEYDQLDSQIQNLNSQINQILTLNWKWFTIIWMFVYLGQLCYFQKKLSDSNTRKNRLQPFVDRLKRANKKRGSFGLQANNRDLNKPTPFQYYEKYQARVKKLLDDMQEIIDKPEEEKALTENKNNEEINNNPNIISTISNNQEKKIGGIGD